MTKKTKANPEDYIGIKVDSYTIKEYINKGAISFVFKAEDDNGNIVACKVIPQEKLKDGWKIELHKMNKLRSIPGVIQYLNNGTAHNKNDRMFTWILLNYVPGINLQEYLIKKPWPLNIAFVEYLANTLLDVLYACHAIEMPHGDLHHGNILISDPDIRTFDNKRMIWVSDFGYGGSHNNKEPKDDIRHFTSMVKDLLKAIHVDELEAEQRILYTNMNNFLSKKVDESDATQNVNFNDFKKLVAEFKNLHKEAQIEYEKVKRGEHTKSVGDYLQAESMPESPEEWRDLFVPDVLNINELLKPNTTVLTGARGCGKTMTFKRLSTYFNKIIGQPIKWTEIPDFTGFYLNCRYLKESFPYIPYHINNAWAARLTHFFHLAWFAEVCKTISAYEADYSREYTWLDDFAKRHLGERYESPEIRVDILAHVQSFIEKEKEYCRFTRFEENNSPSDWPLSRHDFLDSLARSIKDNLPWAYGKPCYFFLDDYTIPILFRRVQKIYNDIVFKRSDQLFFKVSTEAINSIETTFSDLKPIELKHDFVLVDLAAISMQVDESEKRRLLENIFTKRIKRDKYWKDKELTLEQVLGTMNISNNELARKMRETKGTVLYHGIESFIGVWCSDIRTMIQIFASMLNDCDTERSKGIIKIPDSVQNSNYQNFGGDLLVLTELVTNPRDLEKTSKTSKTKIFGSHLKKIVQAFTDVARYELLYGDLISNQDSYNVKQAFRIEVVDEIKLSEEADMYLNGLIRWHIFMQDRRGKSVRGAFNPRFFLNRLLIPHSKLTFSKHDHIHLNNQMFNQLLLEPDVFASSYKKKKRENKKSKFQNRGQYRLQFKKSKKK